MTLTAAIAIFTCFMCTSAPAGNEKPLANPCGELQYVLQNNERISIQVYAVSITQTCKHSTAKNESGQTVWIKPGLLLINGKLHCSAPLGGGNQFEATLEKDSQALGCLVSREEGSTADYVFSGSLYSPPGPFSLGIAGIGDIRVNPLGAGKQGLETTIAGEPAIKRKFLNMGDEQWDTAEFVLNVKNSGACTWTFDWVEVVQATDGGGNRLAEVCEKDPATECPAVTLLPGEEKPVKLRFASKNIAATPRLQFSIPLVPAPAATIPQPDREKAGRLSPEREWKSLKKMKSSVANARAIIAAGQDFLRAFPGDRHAKDVRAKIETLAATLLRVPDKIRAEGIAFSNGYALNLAGDSVRGGTVDLRHAGKGLMTPRQKGEPPSADILARRSRSFASVSVGATLSNVADILGPPDDMFEQVGPNTPYERVCFWRLSEQANAIGWFNAGEALALVYPAGSAASAPEALPPATASTTGQESVPPPADTVPVPQAASLKTALIDRKAIFKKSTKVANGYADLNKWIAELQQPIDALSAQVKKAQTDYDEAKQRMSAAERAAEEYKIESLSSEYQEKLKAEQAKVDAREQAFMNEVNAEIDRAAEDIRLSRGYASVKDLAAPAQGVPPADFADITQDVIDAINRKSEATAGAHSDSGQPADPRLSERVQVRHILVMVAESDSPEQKQAKLLKAEDIRRQLLDGADFAEMARKYSDCPTREQGGDVGVMAINMMLKPLQDAALTRKRGEIGPVVETRVGYHIIQFLENSEQASPAPQVSAYTIPDIRPVGSTISQTDVILEATDKPNAFRISTPNDGGQMEFLLPDLDPDTLAQGAKAKKKTLKLEDMTWHEGARHTLKGNLRIKDYTFISDESEPLVFHVTSQGYVYERGRGTVITPKNEKVVLGSN